VKLISRTEKIIHQIIMLWNYKFIIYTNSNFHLIAFEIFEIYNLYKNIENLNIYTKKSDI